MVKILLCGGCHALVLRDLIKQLFDPGRVETPLIVNCQLIEIAQRRWPLEAYLSLYFHRDKVIIAPIEQAGLHLPKDTGAGETPIDIGTRIFANPDGIDESEKLATYAYLETLPGRAIALDRNTAFQIDSKRWRSTWHA